MGSEGTEASSYKDEACTPESHSALVETGKGTEVAQVPDEESST